MVINGPLLAHQESIPSDLTVARGILVRIESALHEHQFSDKEIFDIKLATEEALVNAIKHGNQLDENKKVHIHYEIHLDRFDIRISDEGSGFDPSDLPDPTDPENLERPCGRGVFLIRHYMNRVSFSNNGTTIVMVKWRSANSGR